jgi:hypothetical protein
MKYKTLFQSSLTTSNTYLGGGSICGPYEPLLVLYYLIVFWLTTCYLKPVLYSTKAGAFHGPNLGVTQKRRVQYYKSSRFCLGLRKSWRKLGKNLCIYVMS